MKWAILGTGTIAKKFATTLFQMRGEGERLVAVASRTWENAQVFASVYGAEKAYGSYEAVMADPNVDAVYIAIPNTSHAAAADMALRAGKHVLCEKPFTIHAAQARALFETARQEKRFIMEAFWIRFLPALLTVRSMIASGEIGELVHLRCDFGFIPGSTARADAKRSTALGAGALMDIGVYNLGFAHMVTDQSPVKIHSTKRLNDAGTDDFSALLLEYPNGVSAMATTAIGVDMPREAAIFGTLGEISLPDFQMAQHLRLRRYGGETRELSFPFSINGFEYQIREVRRCTQLGMNTSDVWREEDTLSVLQTMDQLRDTWHIRFPGDELR